LHTLIGGGVIVVAVALIVTAKSRPPVEAATPVLESVREAA
jgi:hypothetical protein